MSNEYVGRKVNTQGVNLRRNNNENWAPDSMENPLLGQRKLDVLIT